ncbi:MAG TPA: DUF4215 domain-containing protein [Kofleriaceae bacterium]|jgi:cysteine-rich repeat protein|nr:DUF4215 domain-containing protein [Kofleriaceae bacterium]
MWKSMLVAFGVTLGCIQPDLVTCEDGLACPAGDRCDEAHHGCVAPEQLTACTGMVDGTDCTAGAVSGGCFGGVCLARGCGNRVVEAGEACDDGNQISGDGCSGDCRSTERCGNGVVDPGEACDDGNLVSRDGCDSRCRLESASWQVIPIAPTSVDARETAYDAARGRLVTVEDLGGTWEWDGMRWTATASAISPVTVFYDPDRGQVEMIGDDAVSGARARHVYAWDGGAWTVIHSQAPPDESGTSPRLVTAYDAVGHRVFAVEIDASDTDRVWSMDPTGVWTELPSIPAAPEGPVAYDPDAGQLVVEGGGEWVYDGTGWSSSGSGFGARVSLALDPDRGHLVLVDGDSQMTYERVGAVWSAVPDSAVPCGTEGDYRPLYYNAARAALELFTTDSSQICTWQGAWSARATPLPVRPVGATYDPVTHSLVVLHDARAADPAGGIEAWRSSDAGWQRIDTPHAPPGRDQSLVLYSTGRAATVLYGGSIATPISTDWSADTWAFDGSDWSPAASALTDTDPYALRVMTYDSTHGRALLMSNDTWWSLGDGDRAWQPVDLPVINGYPAVLAWDARNAMLVAAGAFSPIDSQLITLGPQGWAPFKLVPADISGGDPATLMSDPRSGGVLVFSLGSGAVWERLGAAWSELPPTPVRNAGQAWTAYSPVDGSVLYVANTNTGMFASVMTRTSATPLESCRPGEDLDGDGLAGCDDGDCYWACSRPSPYAARR